jgi:transposase
MLKALAEGETNPAALAALADERLRATPEQLCDGRLYGVERRLPAAAEDGVRGIAINRRADQPTGPGAESAPAAQDAVERLAEVPGLGVDSAQQIIAEVGPTAATFPSEKCLSSWVGACPGDNESGGVNYSHRSPKGNRHLRRLLNQAANAAARTKGSIFEIVYRRTVPRLGHQQANRGNRPSTVSPDLVDPSSGSSLRRTGPSRHQAVQAKAHGQNDSATSQPRLPDRTTKTSV